MDFSIFNDSVIDTRPDSLRSVTHLFSTIGSAIPEWGGRSWAERDKELEKLAIKEPFLKAALFSIASGRTALQFELDGPPRVVRQSHEMLKHSDLNNGWVSLMMKVVYSVLMYDNGAFVEILRDRPPVGSGRKPESMPVRALNHLDSTRCIRTGDPESPVIYVGDDGRLYALKWYQVLTLEEAPSPHREHYNRQFSFVTRVLEGAKFISEISKYKDEKVSGRFSRAIHVIGGVAKHELDIAKKVAGIDADNAGLLRYMEPVILASLDPNAKVSHVQIDMATLPDHFDEDLSMKWYITLLAMASGGDYQDLAPLPGGDLGTASQSETLHRKSRVRGTQLWMKLVEHKFHVHNVLPRNVSFRFSVSDSAAEAERAQIANLRAQTRAIQIGSGESNPQIARLEAVDHGDMKQDHLLLVGDQSVPGNITVADDEEVIDELTEFTDTPLAPLHAAKAAKWWRQLVEVSPLQSTTPIPESKLRVFEQHLRNSLVKEVYLGTSLGWLSSVLVDAATNSGIPAVSLKQRLPDEYSLAVTNKEIKDSLGRVIYSPPIETKEVFVPKCATCHTEDNVNLIYIPYRGFKHTCANCTTAPHIVLEDKTVKALYKAVAESNNKHVVDTMLAAIQAAYELGYGEPVDFSHVTTVVNEEAKGMTVFHDRMPLVIPTVYKWYLKGLKKALARK